MPTLRLIAVLLGGAILLWLPFEDTTTVWVRLFAVFICALGAVTAGLRIPGGLRQQWYAWPAVGLIAGMLVTPVAVLLMAVKSGIHGHGSPDFTPVQVGAVLNGWPIWALAGMLAGLASAAWQRAR